MRPSTGILQLAGGATATVYLTAPPVMPLMKRSKNKL
jgi:hypothetical protein